MSGLNKTERIKQLKEVLKKRHDQETELRLKAMEDLQPLARYSKYRRSASTEQASVSRYIKRAGGISSNDQEAQQWDTRTDARVFEEIKDGKVHELASCFEIGERGCNDIAENGPHSSEHLTLLYSQILPSCEQVTDERLNLKHKPSILKRKDDNHSGGGASVSFDLDSMISEPMNKTKSSDSNLSLDTETGYWSGGENVSTRVLKTRLKDLQHDQKSILKDRRSSLGSSSPESSLHGILKRKLSYDSSTFLHGANSFSTNALDCVSSEPKPILKKKSSSEELDETEWTNPKPILKKQSTRGDYSHSSSSDGLDDGNIRPILKKSVQLEDNQDRHQGDRGCQGGGRGILKRIGRKGVSNYYSMEESLHQSSLDRSDTESIYYGIRHSSLPNPKNGTGDLTTLASSMERSHARTDSEEDIISTLTVAEKRSIFLQMERENARAVGVERRIEKRHATQPVTLEEIEKASQLISSIPIEQLKTNIMKDEPKQLLGTMLGELSERQKDSTTSTCHASSSSFSRRTRTVTKSVSLDVSLHREAIPGESVSVLNVMPLASASSSEEDPCKLSLQERVRLFNTLATSSSASFARPVKRPVTSRRFQTQPVTELEKRFLIQRVESGPRAGGGTADELELPRSSKNDEEVDCGKGSVSDEGSALSDDAEEGMRDRIGVQDGEKSSKDQSFLKKRVKSSPYEIGEMEVDAGICEKSGNIASKIAALQTNGEMNWKKRICKPIIKNVLVDEGDNDRNIEIAANNKDSPSVVANRLSLLTKSQTGWKQRVSENDATNLTVQAKLEKAGKFKDGEVLSEKKVKEANALTPTTFTSKIKKTSVLTKELEKKLTVVKNLQFPAAQSPARKPVTEGAPDARIVRNISSNEDEAFRNFFPSAEVIRSNVATASVEFSLDDVTRTDRKFLGVRRNVRVNRSHIGVRNPIKSLASRLPEQSYLELKPEVREKEMKKRIQVENLSKSSHLSAEALAGLVSKEDFTAVRLKRPEREARTENIPSPMLIRIKGKRFVQIRIVPPVVASLSTGDCFILITKDEVYQYIGEFSNRMEKSKLADTLAHFVLRRDLGIQFTSVTQVVTLEGPPFADRAETKAFFDALGGNKMETEADEALGDEGDEAYEAGVIRTNRVFEVDPVKQELVPLLGEGGWGTQPKISILKDFKVLVFDFGSEMYVWSGSRADAGLKRAGTLLAREMFEDSYNFSEVGHEYSPLGPEVAGDNRPDWCWFKRVTHHMEPILFVEKFFDWPDESGKLVRVKSFRESGKDGGFSFEACNVDTMMAAVEQVEDPVLDLEGFNVSRGREVHDEIERRHYVVTTLEVNAWRVSEFSKTPIDPDSMGHFYSTETYVVRWQYSVIHTGRDLQGNQSKHGGILGRPRTAYFFWHGKDSKATEQGASALMTVELDSEKGPQIRLVQGREPPAFLGLFNGQMFVHMGSPEESALRNLRLYVTLGCLENEGHFLEVPAVPESFRSRGSFLVVDNRGAICTWHGCHTSSVSEKIAQNGAKLILSSPKEFGLPTVFRIAEAKEGEETKELWERMGLKTEMEWREAYTSLRAETGAGSSQIAVFQFTSLKGTLEPKLLLSPKRKTDEVQNFPVVQEDLYGSRQPGLFLLVHGSNVWLWQGWIPCGDEENENTATGSGEYRWAAERKATLETGMDFVKRKNGRGLLVHAGLEPPLFRCLFPYWSTHHEAHDCNLADGKVENGAISFSTAMEPFMKRTFTLEQLQDRPEGVDLLRLEDYLSDGDFSSLLKMSRNDFEKLQQWRKTELKKQVGLF